MLRRRGVETEVAAAATADRDAGREPRTESVFPAPMLVFESDRSSGILPSEITVVGTCWRRFMFGYKSVPPATYIPVGPASAFHFRASARVAGTRYRKAGSRSIRPRP